MRKRPMSIIDSHRCRRLLSVKVLSLCDSTKLPIAWGSLLCTQNYFTYNHVSYHWSDLWRRSSKNCVISLALQCLGRRDHTPPCGATLLNCRPPLSFEMYATNSLPQTCRKLPASRHIRLELLLHSFPTLFDNFSSPTRVSLSLIAIRNNNR